MARLALEVIDMSGLDEATYTTLWFMYGEELATEIFVNYFLVSEGYIPIEMIRPVDNDEYDRVLDYIKSQMLESDWTDSHVV